MEASMKRNSHKTTLAVFALTLLSAVYAAAQTDQQPQPGKEASDQTSKKTQGGMNHRMSDTDMSGRLDEPHHVLAMAYKENVARFGKALQDQARGGALSSDFARAAVSEMSRSLDQSDEHHAAYVKTMSGDTRLKMASILNEISARSSKLREAFRILEKDVGEYTLNSKQIVTDTGAILQRLEDMPKMHQPD
jgi:hypothetical protein